jgi:aminomethyltransferase
VIGIELEDRAVPRHGYPVLHDGVQVGEVTTGYKSISTGKSVCMALVETPHAKLGTPLMVQIRKKTFPGVVVKKRFYDKHYKK